MIHIIAQWSYIVTMICMLFVLRRQGLTISKQDSVIEDLEDLLEQQKDHIEYLTQANQTLRQNKGRIPREDEQ